MYEIRQINKYFNRHGSNQIHVINDISLSLPDTGLIAIYGISGCGKTTLLNVLGGIDSFAGSITVNGEKLDSSTADILRNKYIGYIFQNYNLDQNATVYENVKMSLKLAGITDEEEQKKRIYCALENVGIEKFRNRYPSSLSGGQQQRVAIARAIAKAPQIILADEPTGNLDEANTQTVMNILKQLSADRLVLLVTHEQELVEHYCDTVITLGDGKVVSVEDNVPDDSYSGGDPRKIYLGDLKKSEINGDDIGIELFADGNPEAMSSPSLRIIRSKGKIYLQCLDSKIKIVDGRSEIKLVDSTSAEEERASARKKLNLSSLTPARGKKLGAVFGFTDSVKEGYRSVFRGQRFGKKLLIAALLIFAASLVFSVSSFGTVIYGIQTGRLSYNEKAIYVKLENEDDVAELQSALSDKSEAHLYVPGYDLSSDNALPTHSFYEGGFESADFSRFSVKAYSSTIGEASYGKLVCGSLPAEGEDGVVVSSALADYLLSTGIYSFMNDYYQVLLLECDSMKITGIVESGDMCVYYKKGYIAEQYVSLNFSAGKASSVSSAELPKVEKGHVIINSYYFGEGYVKGDKIEINGIEFTVDGTVSIYEENTQYNNDYYYNYDYYGGGYGGYDMVYRMIGYYISDEDFETLSNMFIGSFTYMAVYSDNLDSDLAAIRDTFPSYTVVTPDELDDEIISKQSEIIISKLITLCVMIIILGVCLYLIMRSSMMSRIKEIGIYRAIGASKKNILFKFLCETLLVTTLTVFIGYLGASFVVTELTGVSSIMYNIAYYPLWLAGVTLVLLYALSIFTGLLPAITLMHKTPAEILAVYDI